MYFQLVDNQAVSTRGQPDVVQPAPPPHLGNLDGVFDVEAAREEVGERHQAVGVQVDI